MHLCNVGTYVATVYTGVNPNTFSINALKKYYMYLFVVASLVYCYVCDEHFLFAQSKYVYIHTLGSVYT